MRLPRSKSADARDGLVQRVQPPLDGPVCPPIYVYVHRAPKTEIGALANRRRNQERDAAAPPDLPVYVQLLDEEVAKQPGTLTCKAAFFAMMQRALCLGLFDDIEQVQAWAISHSCV